MPELQVALDRLQDLSYKALCALCAKHHLSAKNSNKKTAEVLIRKFENQGGVPVDAEDVDAWIYENTPKSRRRPRANVKPCVEPLLMDRPQSSSSGVTARGVASGSSPAAASSSVQRRGTSSKGKGKQRATTEDEQDEEEVNKIVQAQLSHGNILVPGTQESSIQSFTSQPAASKEATPPTEQPAPPAGSALPDEQSDTRTEEPALDIIGITTTPSSSQINEVNEANGAPGTSITSEDARQDAWDTRNRPGCLRAVGIEPAPRSLPSTSLQSITSLPANQLGRPPSPGSPVFPLFAPGTAAADDPLARTVLAALEDRVYGGGARERVVGACVASFWTLAEHALCRPHGGGGGGGAAAVRASAEGLACTAALEDALRRAWVWLGGQLEARAEAGPSPRVHAGRSGAAGDGAEDTRMEGSSSRVDGSRERGRASRDSGWRAAPAQRRRGGEGVVDRMEGPSSRVDGPRERERASRDSEERAAPAQRRRGAEGVEGRVEGPSNPRKRRRDDSAEHGDRALSFKRPRRDGNWGTGKTQ